LREVTCCWRRTKLVRLRVDKEETGSHEEYHRHQLPDRERVADNRCFSDTQQVDHREHGDNKNDDRRSPNRARRLQPKITHITDQEITVGGEGSDAREPKQPTDFERHSRLERLARIQVWPTRLVEAAAHLGKAKYD